MMYPTPDSGVDTWKAWADSLPLAEMYGVRCARIEEGRYECVLDKSPLSLNPNGALNGGVTAAVADLCMGVVAMTVLSPAKVGVTANLVVEYHRPAFLPLTFNSTLASWGRTLMFVDVDVVDREGRVCVRGRGTMAVRSAELMPLPRP